jgi:hypothetical protein
MSMTFDKLQSILKEAGIRYLLAPDQPMLAFGMMTESGRHVLIHCFLEIEGTLLQLRTNGYHICPPDSPHQLPVLKLVNELNHRLRLVKFTIDPLDGEVTVFADLAILDSEPTAPQVLGLVGFFMDRLREHAERIEETIRTGIDPGNVNPFDMPGDVGGEGGGGGDEGDDIIR